TVTVTSTAATAGAFTVRHEVTSLDAAYNAFALGDVRSDGRADDQSDCPADAQSDAQSDGRADDRSDCHADAQSDGSVDAQSDAPPDWSDAQSDDHSDGPDAGADAGADGRAYASADGRADACACADGARRDAVRPATHEPVFVAAMASLGGAMASLSNVGADAVSSLSFADVPAKARRVLLEASTLRVAFSIALASQNRADEAAAEMAALSPAAVDEAISVAAAAAGLTAAFAALRTRAVAVSGYDAGVLLSATELTVGARASFADSYSVSLASRPLANVRVALEIFDAVDVALSPESLLFSAGADWADAQTVT
ncbi:hypothetical protein M885DRAFT_561161, partial [Pelagophyceae sp. CCMP2097]